MSHADHGQYREEFADEHPHSYDHHEPKYPVIWLILGGTVVFLAISGIAVQAYVEGLWTSMTFDKVLSQDNLALDDLRKKEQEELTKFGVADAKAKVMRMPIDQAVKLVISDSSAGKPKYPVAPYKVKTPEELAQSAPALSQPGTAALEKNQTQGGLQSHPDANRALVPQQPNK